MTAGNPNTTKTIIPIKTESSWLSLGDKNDSMLGKLTQIIIHR